MDIQIRPFELADHAAVNELCQWAWWPPRSAQGWRWLVEGPSGETVSGPPGWVCDGPDGVQAFVGNFIQRFFLGDDSFEAATGHTLLVHPNLRGASRDLLRRFVRQDTMFARYTFNANDRSAPLYKHFAMHPWPPGQSAVKYVWRTDLPGVAQERALRWVHGFSGNLASRSGGEHFNSERLWTGRVKRCAPGVTPIAITDIDERFDNLWAALRQDGRLLARRDAASLRWRCGDPDLTREPLLLGYEADGVLAGYLLAFFSKGSEVEQPALEIIDLIALRSHQDVAIPALVRTVLASSRGLGVARVRLPMVNAEMERLLTPFSAARKVYHHDHCHVRWAEDVSEDLKSAWFSTPYDGDYSFCLRPPPRLAYSRAA